MLFSKPTILSGLAVIAPATVSALEPSSVPDAAHCFSIAYSTAEIAAAAGQCAHLPLDSIQGFPMAYPLSSMRFAWPDHGDQFPATGYPWAASCKDTRSLQKYPLVSASITGGGAWDGHTSRSSSVGGGNQQSDFVFLDAKGEFCLIATETPLGVDGWLPCVWE